MKNRKLFAVFGIGGMTLACASAILIGLNKDPIQPVKTYQPDEYIPEENAYYGGEITDPAGHIKAHKFVTPTDNKYSSQKTRSLGTSLIGDIESVWTSYTGKGTKIAIIDDGFDYEHPEYTRSDGTSAILPESRYYYESGSSYKYKSYTDDPTCIGEDWESDGNGGYEWATHGTATSTTAAAPMNNGGGVGIAPEADILALKIDFSFASIEGAIRYAVDQGVDVINMSLGAYAESFTDGWGEQQSGSSSTSTYLNSACNYAYNNNVIVVAAAGNESTWHKSYPACNSHVIGVGALGDWDNKGNATALAEFTNYVKSNQTGEINVDILAPGYVYTAERQGKQSSPTHTYDDTQGTSFSSPIIAGAACLWKQKNPSGTPDQFLSALQSSADGIGYYTDKYIPVSGWDSSLSDVGPSAIANGRLNVANLLDINEPYVSTVQSNLNISVGEKKQIDLETYNGTITYSSSNTSVATVSNSGLVTGIGAGSATITVTASKNNHTATATVGVNVAAIVAASSISFSPKSVNLTVGDTYNSEETITVTPSNASRIFLFESEDTSVATVDEDTGLITAVGAGDTTINAIAGYGTGDDSLSIHVDAPSGPTSWEKVTSDSDLENGDYLIVYEDGGYAFDGGLDTLDAGSNRISVSISNNKITWDSTTDAAKFTINSMSGGYSIQSASGKYISGTSGSNVLNSGTSPVANSISISGGNADIVSNTSVLRFNSDSSQSRFRYFKSSSYTNQKAIQLYKANSSGVTPTPTPTVSSVTVSPSSLSLDLNGTTSSNLTAIVNGTNNPAQTVNWASSDPSKVTVSSSGQVTAIAVTSSPITITATSTVDSTKSGSCSVTVTDSTPVEKTLSSISISGQTTSLEVGSSFNFGGTVTAHFSDSSSSDVTLSATYSGYNMSVAGDYTVTVSYTYSGTTKTTTYTLTVYSSGGGGGSGESGSVTYSVDSKTSASVSSGDAPSGSSIGFYNNGSNSNDQMTSGNYENWTLNGYEGYTLTSLTARLKRNSSKGTGTVALTNNGDSVTVSKATYARSDLTSSYNSYEILAGNLDVEGTVVLTLTSTENSFWCDSITVTYESSSASDKIVMSLSASYSGGNVYVGDSLDESKVSVTVNYTDSSKYPSTTLNSTDYSLSGFSSSSAGQKTVTVTYTGSLQTFNPTVTTTFNVSVINDSITSVTVSNNNTYHPGDTIAKNDITVTLHYQSGKSSTTTDFIFANDGYMFTYSDAPSGGSNGSKQFSITYDNNSYNFNVNVNRTAYQTISGQTVTLSSDEFSSSDLSKNSSTASNTSVTIDGVGFTVTTNAYVFTSNNTNYLSFGKGIGSIKNSSAFDNDLESISVTQKNGARQDGVLTISKDGSNWVGYSTNELASGGYRFFKYEYTSASSVSGAGGYSNLQSISYTLSGKDNPTNVSNYIMYEDTNGQCVSKLDVAIGRLNSMSAENKTIFWTSNDYVIATARERLSAWAIHEGRQLSFNNGNFSASNLRNRLLTYISGEDFPNIIAIVLISSLTLATSLLFVLKRKKETK